MATFEPIIRTNFITILKFNRKQARIKVSGAYLLLIYPVCGLAGPDREM